MELILNVVGAVVCASMAKKRGRGSVRWFFLGLFFHVVAIGVLYFLGRRNDRRTSSPAISTPVGEWGSPVPDPNSRTATPRNLPGHVDLNELRAALRGGGQEGPHPSPVSHPINQDDAMDSERKAFLNLIEELAPTIEFSGLPTIDAKRLREEWLKLGRVFVRSGEAGGVTDGMEFYQLDQSGLGPPVLFYPAAPNDGRSVFVVQFACPVKRFRHTSTDLVAWVDTRTNSGFASATLFHDVVADEFVLLSAGVMDMASTPINECNLGALCEQVRSQAQGLRHDIPSRFGGIWAVP